jgi:hypothetical protein
MQDVVQIGMDEELMNVFEGVSAGGRVRITLDLTVSEIDEDRFVGTIDAGGVDPDVRILDGEEEEEEFPIEDSEEDPEEDPEEEYEEYEEE